MVGYFNWSGCFLFGNYICFASTKLLNTIAFHLNIIFFAEETIKAKNGKNNRKVPWSIERLIVGSLILMMIVFIFLSIIELGRMLVLDIITPPNYLLDINELLDVYGFFMLILIGVELLETIRAYLNEHEVHVEIVLEVALIAVARKVAIIDVKDSPLKLSWLLQQS